MSWKETLLPGSFRNVPFVIESADGEIGRNVALHEFPLRDKPYAEDLGKKARRFRMNLFVLGADYMAARDALIAALEEPGPGKLVHPYLGEMTATVIEARGPRESTREGGMARFAVTFVESGEAVFPRATADTAKNTESAADTASAAVQSAFSDTFVADSPQFVVDHAKSLVHRVSDQIDAVRRRFPNVPDMVSDFVSDLQGLAASAEELIRAPADLATDIYGLVADIVLLPDRIDRAFDAYRQLWDLFTDESAALPAGTAKSIVRKTNNTRAFNALVRRAAVVEAVRATASVAFDSYDDAKARMEELADQMDAEAETAGDESYVALMDLRAAMVADITKRGANLARVRKITPGATIPALVLAHRLYGDATQAENIVARNRIAHPGFVPGGEELEVLIDG